MGGVAAINLAGILLESDVADVMQAVFDAPMAAPPAEEARGSRLSAWYAGHGIFDFDGLLTSAGGCASEATCLSEPRPIGVSRQPRADLQTASNNTPVLLGNCLEAVKM